MNVKALPAEIQDQVYRPGEDEQYNVDVDLGAKEVFGDEESEEAE